ncbi:glycosyltransferase family 4 protein [Neobacillus sp. OS1-2]|uniref:glycosyltransferase family 4 protein n=1 Tax=Neobacillus sp. OS1-2 TaxID=3070680 RepID=UPI0027DEB3F1|nr:glycosyltransferase family 4 protein [Neobacillus sp. OS1-2]WML39954.1 glycosyltransferase family 4 protein [Neobacillus sp. OS1-2]
MSQKGKVAIITPGSFPIPGVKSSSVERVVLKVTELLQEEIDFYILGKKTLKQPFYEKKGSITFHRYHFQYKTYIQQIIKQLQDIEPDIIQIENRPRFVKMVRLAMPKVKIILVMQSTRFMSRPHIGTMELTACFEAADAIVVNSHFLKEYILKETPCSTSKIEVNHLGVDVEQFQSKWQGEQKATVVRLKREWKVTDKKILLYMGRLIEIKGVHHILEAMPEIIKNDPSIILFIAGITLTTTPEYTAYERRLQKLAEKMKEHVIFTPFVPHEQIQHWYQLADLLVVPSEAEPFGLVNVEAMATGTPVIATNSGGIPEIIDHGKTGILINPDQVRDELISQISSLFLTPAKLKQMGEAGMLRVKNHFTWSHTAKRQLALYRKLLQR